MIVVEEGRGDCCGGRGGGLLWRKGGVIVVEEGRGDCCGGREGCCGGREGVIVVEEGRGDCCGGRGGGVLWRKGGGDCCQLLSSSLNAYILRD